MLVTRRSPDVGGLGSGLLRYELDCLFCGCADGVATNYMRPPHDPPFSFFLMCRPSSRPGMRRVLDCSATSLDCCTIRDNLRPLRPQGASANRVKSVESGTGLAPGLSHVQIKMRVRTAITIALLHRSGSQHLHTAAKYRPPIAAWRHRNGMDPRGTSFFCCQFPADENLSAVGFEPTRSFLQWILCPPP